MKRKSLLFLLLMAVFVPWAAQAQVTIGSGTSTSIYVPGNTYYEHAISQQIYTADEINASGNITSIALYNTYRQSYKSDRLYDIYMAHTSKTAFTDGKDWIALTSSNLVYHAESEIVLNANEWTVITLDTPFNYNGTDNLVICIIDNTGLYNSSGSENKCRVFSTESNYQAIYAYSDSYTSLTPNGYNGTTQLTGTRMLSKNQIILGGIHQTCAKPTNLAATLDATDHTIATLTWTENGEATSWVLQVATNNTFDEGLQSHNVSTNPSKGLTGLTPETKYYARVRPSCSETAWSNVCEFKPTAEICAEIGAGTTASSSGGYGGIYTYYNYYAYTQQLYTATELTAAGAIAGTVQSIALRFAETTACNLTFEVYLGQTTATSLSSAWISDADLTKVYDGTTTFSGDKEWNHISTTGIAEWEWDGTSNIVVAIRRTNNTSPAVTYPDFYYTSATGMCRYYTSGSGGSNIELNSNNVPSSASATGSTTADRPDMDFCFLASATPKPRNLQVSDISSSSATLTWEAPANATPTSYQYRLYNGINWTSWESTSNLSVDLNLSASTPYTFQLKAMYDGVGESDPIEVDFTTLDDCAVPTNLVATTTPGVGTKATLSWTKGFGEDNAWVLEYGTDNTFATCTTVTEGFTVQGNTVSFVATTGITAEELHYARVKTDCGGTYSTYSNVAEFTPTNYVDFHFRETASSSTDYVPFNGSYTTSATNQSQFVIPAAQLSDELIGGSIRSITYYTTSTTTTTDWGGVTFDVYMAEVENTTFSYPITFIDWNTLTNVYTGTVSLNNGEMTIDFNNNYTYNGGNLLIGFKTKDAGTTTKSVSWKAYYGSSYNTAYQYGSNSASRNYYQPKITFNYQPTPYKYPVIDENNCTFGTTSAHIAWTVTDATPISYAFMYKKASDAEWPASWTWNGSEYPYADLPNLTPGTLYDFRVKAIYEGNHESAVVDYEFWTQCAIVTAFPWKEDFEAYSAGDFIHPCWQNVHISGDGTYIFKVYTSANGTNSTHQLQLPDQSNPTYTKLRLPEMTLPNNGYQFVIDVYRSHYSTVKPGEGITVYASADGNLEGATKLAFIPRQYDLGNDTIPAVETPDWYTYELPIPMSGTCYIVLQGKNEFGQSTYMDNLGVEEIPTCARPKDLAYSNVTNHSAKLNWTAGDTEQTLWQVAYSKTSFDPNTANFDVTTVSTVDATANPFVLAGLLDAASTYYVYVRANCGTATEPDYGPWCRKGVSFTTLVATPAPSNFVASNPASEKVDMTWNAGGGDFESWELYYVKSETAPEDPTATTTATVTNITTLPTTEEPYVLDELDPVSKYYAWIRAKHVWNNETTYSDWVALTGDYFETLDACPTPTDLVATNLTSVSADLSWVGSDDVDSYTVQYRTAAGMSNTVLNENFTSFASTSSLPTDWTKLTGLVDDAVAGTAPTVTTSTYGVWRPTTYAFGNTNATLNIYGSSCKSWLASPEITLGTGQNLNFDLALTDYGNSNEIENPDNQADDRFAVVIFADNAWTILREWNDGTSPYGYSSISTTGENVTISLAAYDGKTVKIAFYGESTAQGGDNDLHIDNVVVGTPTPAGSWANATTSETNQSYTLPGLTAGIKYDVRVKSNCTSGEYCEPISFTTLAEGNMVFTNATNDGKWGNSGNWAPAQLPVLTDEVILRANATIESGCVAEAKKINLNSNTLTIADGGQLKTDNTVTATVKKNIAGYEGTNDHYYLIGNPLSSNVTVYNSDNTYNIRKGTYDLYSWSRTSNLEWTNYGSANTSTLYMYNGTGYLYANAEDRVITFTGTVKANNTDVTMNPSYTAPSGQTEFSDWNLFANPFVCDAYINDVDEKDAETPMAFYRMNEQGDGYVAATGAIHPMEGIFVQATKSSQSFKFSRTQTETSRGQLNINLSKAGMRGVSLADNAIVRFGEGSTLEKFSFRENSSKIYIPMEGKDYAVVNAGQTGEMPVSFKAENNGSYTLSFSNENVEFSYLHLIDNMTGMDVNLLDNPSYSFEARTTDYAQRFRLVFATGSSIEDESFGFFNESGNFCIFGIEGNATVQVIDMMGRVLSSETVSGSYEKQISGTPGVYMVRLINGDNVRTQKVVVK